MNMNSQKWTNDALTSKITWHITTRHYQSHYSSRHHGSLTRRWAESPLLVCVCDSHIPCHDTVLQWAIGSIFCTQMDGCIVCVLVPPGCQLSLWAERKEIASTPVFWTRERRCVWVPWSWICCVWSTHHPSVWLLSLLRVTCRRITWTADSGDRWPRCRLEIQWLQKLFQCLVVL